MPTETDSGRPRRGRLAQVVGAVVVSMLAFGLVAVVLAELWPPTFSQRRMVAYSVAMVAVGVAAVTANVWAAVQGRHRVSPPWRRLSPGEVVSHASGLARDAPEVGRRSPEQARGFLTKQRRLRSCSSPVSEPEGGWWACAAKTCA